MFVIKGLKRINSITAIAVFRIRAANGLYFRWCYIDGAKAEVVALKLNACEREFHPTNWTRDPEECALSQTERDKIKHQ